MYLRFGFVQRVESNHQSPLLKMGQTNLCIVTQGFSPNLGGGLGTARETKILRDLYHPVAFITNPLLWGFQP